MDGPSNPRPVGKGFISVVILIPNPGYPTYKAAATIAGANCVAYDLTAENNWAPDFTSLEKTDLSKVKLMFVNYPHMPTGQLATEELFSQLVSFAKKHNIFLSLSIFLK